LKGNTTMSRLDSRSRVARRSFLSRLGLGLTTGGVALGTGDAAAQTQSAGEGGRWQAARHAQDDWFDQIPGKHRFIFDTTTPEGFGDALTFLNNYITANQNAYGVRDADLALVLVARHLSTLFAYNDAVWAKYGVTITQRTNFNDPKTKRPPTINLFNSPDYGTALTNRGNTLDSLLKRGIHLAVCQVSTRGNATAIAAATGGTAEAVYNELVANLISRNAHIVPAGIVAVNRAQERGYSLVSA
jgi:intracellular sulfur oxidation DsrE/DsrF family protein